jgi:hypothetical protein
MASMRTLAIFSIAATSTIAACSSDPQQNGRKETTQPTQTTTPAASTTPSPCTERSGTCLDLQEQIVDLSNSTVEKFPGCDNRSTGTDYACRVQLDTTCPNHFVMWSTHPVDGSDSTYTAHGPVDWSPDGSKGTGVIQMTFNSAKDNSVVCSGTYDVTITRL